MTRRSKFIVFEGIDGCGKETQMLMAAQYIFAKDKAYNLELIREPTYGKIGAQIREILKSEKDPLSGAEKCFELHVQDRAENRKKIIYPALNKDLMGGRYTTVVLCDRYWFSTYAYQGAQGIDKSRIANANKHFLIPDLTLIYDLEVKAAEMRREGRDKGKREKFEQTDFQEKVRQNYLELRILENHRIKIINANPTISDISYGTWDFVKNVISDKRSTKASIDYIFKETKRHIDKILPY